MLGCGGWLQLLVCGIKASCRKKCSGKGRASRSGWGQLGVHEQLQELSSSVWTCVTIGASHRCTHCDGGQWLESDLPHAIYGFRSLLLAHVWCRPMAEVGVRCKPISCESLDCWQGLWRLPMLGKAHAFHGVSCCLACVITRTGLAAGADFRLQCGSGRGNKKGLRQVVSANIKMLGVKTSVVRPQGLWGGYGFLGGKSCWGPLCSSLLESVIRSSVMKAGGLGGWSAASARVIELLGREGWEQSNPNCYSLPFFLASSISRHLSFGCLWEGWKSTGSRKARAASCSPDSPFPKSESFPAPGRSFLALSSVSLGNGTMQAN